MEHQICIDREKCLGCGSCARCCGTGYLRIKDGLPRTGGHIRCIGCGHCIAACPAGALTLDGQGAVPPSGNAMENIFLCRRSVRHFRDDAPDKAILQRALDIAQYAPSGKNRHENRWSVVWGAERCREVSRLGLRWCRESGQSPELLYLADKGIDLLTCHAPVVIIGWSPDNALNPCVDAVIAMHTVQMLLEEKGLGCCWGGYLRDIAAHCGEMKTLLGIPEGCSMQCCMMVGWPKGEQYPNIPPRPGAEAYWV